MIDVRSLYYSHKRTLKMLSSIPQDRPLGVQLLGKDPYFISKAVELLQKYSFDFLDFNAACPQKKIAAHGKGAGLLKTPVQLKELLQIMVKESAVPVTVKIRTGWEDSRDAASVALHAQDAGIKALIVHGRTKNQLYSGGVDYEAIRRIKKALHIPVIASGDIFSGILAKKMFDETGCDAVAVARGALGNPWIFKEIKEYLKHGKIIPRPSLDEVGTIMKQHFAASVQFFGERIGVIDFRKFYIWYTHNFPQVRSLRSTLSKIKTQEEMLHLIDAFAESVREFQKKKHEVS